MSEEVKGIKFYRLESEVEGDETLKGSLGASDVDGNFYYLREMLISSAYTAEYSVEEADGTETTTAELVLTRVNGKELHVNMTPFLPNFEEYDLQTAYNPTLGELELMLYKDEELVTVNRINGLVTDANFKQEFDNAVDFEVIKRVLSDDTIKGIGTKDQILGVNPLYINGQMRPAVSYVDVTIENKLPEYAEVGEYYVVKDFNNEYGKLYPYSAIKKIQKDLDADALLQFNVSSADTSNIGWRIPCEEDWDDMLNAVELEYAKSIGCVEYDASGNCHSTLDTYPEYTHSSTDFIGYALGYIAGRLLRSKDYWSGSTENKGWQCGSDYIGTDSFGFKAEPVGYGMIDEILLMHGKEGSMWIAGTGGNFTPKSKLYQYDYITFYGKGNAKAKTFIASGATDGGPANRVKTDLTTTDSYRSIRLVKEYDGGNFHNRENILGRGFDTIMLPSLTAENGYKIWTVENFDIDAKQEDGTYRYGSKPSLNDSLDDATLFKNYYLAYKNTNNWEYRELSNGDSVVIANPIYSGDNAFDEYRLINGELVDVTTDEYKIYNRIADVEQNVEQLKKDFVRTSVWAWGAIDDVTKLASGNSIAISALTDNVNGLTEELYEFESGTNQSIELITNALNSIFGSISGMASLSALTNLVSNVNTISADVIALSAQEASDVELLNKRVDTISGNVDELSAGLKSVSATVVELSTFMNEYSGDIMGISSISADLYALSATVSANYDTLIAYVDSKVSELRQELIEKFNSVLAKMQSAFKSMQSEITAIKEDICTLQQAVELLKQAINGTIPALSKRIEDIENINASGRLDTLEEKVAKCCGPEGESGETITLEYIKNLINTAVDNSRLKQIYINGAMVASEGNGIDNLDCGTFVHYNLGTNNSYFIPVTSASTSTPAKAGAPAIAKAPSYYSSTDGKFIPQGNIDLDDVTPYNVGGIPCGTSLRDLSGTNLSLLLQNILFPTVNPTIYQNPDIVLTNAEPLVSADIEGEIEKDGCYEQKGYLVVEVGTNFHYRDVPAHEDYVSGESVGYYDDAMAYIKCDCCKVSGDQQVSLGTSGASYLIKENPYNYTTEGNNIVYPRIGASSSFSNNPKYKFKTIGEIEIKAEAKMTPIEGELLNSNGRETDDVYVTTDDGKQVLTTLTALKTEGASERYNYFSRVSNTLNVYVSEPIFLINGQVLASMLQGNYSSAGNPIDYAGWKKGYAQDEEGVIYPKNGIGSIIAMQKWGQMNAQFNIVTDFVSLQFGVLSPIELSSISMKAYDTNSEDNVQTSNFVSKDALLEVTYNYYATHQEEWINKNVPNGLVKYDKPVYVKFQCWDDCSQVSIATYYLYVWVGGAQVPTTFKVTTNNPFADTEESIEKQ